MSQFVHLNVHTDRSLFDSVVTVGGLVSASAEQGAPSVAITDHMNMFGQISFYQKALAAGVKPISAIEIRVLDGDRIGLMTLYAQDISGYKNLMAMISHAYENGFQSEKDDYPVLTKDVVESYAGGLIALSGARHGLLGQALMDIGSEGSEEPVHHELEWLTNTFGKDNVFIELQRTGLSSDEDHVHRAVDLAAQTGTPVVATNPVRFISPDQYRAHEVRAAISEGITEFEFSRMYGDRYTQHMYLKSGDEMAELFDDIPSAIDNTVNIARRCSLELELGNAFLPKFPVPEGQTESDFLREESIRGLNKRLDFLFGLDNPDIENIRKEYDERLEFELGIINDMGFPGYFLIVSDFIQWAKNNDVPVGPGRGSGAGSLVAYSLGVTDLDPMRYDLLFERFLNPERVSMPDFDVDFCMDRRDLVIDYVADKYGHEAVSQIVTFSTLAAKVVVRDVARSLGYSFRVQSKVANLIPSDPGIKLKDALENEVAFQVAYQNDHEVKEVVDLALQMEGMSRQTGKHAGGVLIADGPLINHTPLYNNAHGDSLVSQFDKNDVETAGLVKFDFLGLRNLTVIQSAVNFINQRNDLEKPLDISRIALDDPEVFKLLQEGRTTAVFQVESPGMKKLLRKMKPDTDEDLIALVALYRPGPLESGMVDNFIDRKHGREEISYPDPNYQHELLKPILEPTYGIILYQEQVMQIAQALAGYSLGQADLLRRAMGKKKPEEMAKQRTMFAEGAKEQGIDPNLASKIFDLVEKFAGYGFNKSHSAAYGLISYQTAWLKTHYPSEYMAAVMSSDMDKTEKVVRFINECRNMGLEVLPPSVNKSGASFTPTSSTTISYGLGAIKSVGGSALETIISEREANGEYRNVYDLIRRVNPNIRVLRALITSGALDEFDHIVPDNIKDPDQRRSALRSTLLANAKTAQDYIRGKKEKAKKGKIDDLFDTSDENLDVTDVPGFLPQQKMTLTNLLSHEKKVLGLYLSNHPMNPIRDEIPDISEFLIGDVVFNHDSNDEQHIEQYEGVMTLSGVVMDLDIRTQKKGTVAYFKIDDGSGQVPVRVFSKVFSECQHALQEDAVLSIEGYLRYNKKTGTQDFTAKTVKDLKMVRDATFAGIAIDLEPTRFTDEVRKELQNIINEQPPGNSAINVRVKVGKQSRLVPIGDKKVAFSDDLMERLTGLFDSESVSLLTHESQSLRHQAKTNRRAYAEKMEEGRATFDQRMEEQARIHEELKQAMGL